MLDFNGSAIRQPAIRSGQDGVFSNMLLTQCKTSAVCAAAKYHYVQRVGSTFNSLKWDPSSVPRLIEQHLRVLRNFYLVNNLFESQVDRYLLFLQDETYKLRYELHLGSMDKKDSDHIYLAIKSELISKISRISNSAQPYFKKEFLEIVSMTSEEHREVYGK